MSSRVEQALVVMRMAIKERVARLYMDISGKTLPRDDLTFHMQSFQRSNRISDNSLARMRLSPVKVMVPV
jgi:hypothetical protein